MNQVDNHESINRGRNQKTISICMNYQRKKHFKNEFINNIEFE